jgi:hypothetical protein
MEYVTNSAFNHLPKGIARRYDSRYDVVIRTLDDGTRTKLHPMLQTPSGEYVRFEDYAQLVEKCERLTKAGDEMHRAIKVSDPILDWKIELWNAAKEGKQS